jgi:hypothetical protein
VTFLFSKTSRPALRPTQTRIQWVRSSSPGLKRPPRDGEHSHSSSAEVKNEWNYTSTPLYAFMASAAGTLFSTINRRRLQTMKLFGIQYSAVSCYLLALRPNKLPPPPHSVPHLSMQHSPEASAAMYIRSALFWDVTQRRVVIIYRRFGTSYWPPSSRFKKFKWIKNCHSNVA